MYVITDVFAFEKQKLELGTSSSTGQNRNQKRARFGLLETGRLSLIIETISHHQLTEKWTTGNRTNSRLMAVG